LVNNSLPLAHEKKEHLSHAGFKCGLPELRLQNATNPTRLTFMKS
jgi:hypothetical protein